MWFHSLFASMKSGLSRSRRPQPRPARRGARLVLEQLEDRTLPSSYLAASVSALIADINAANIASGANTISLTAATTSPYVLTAINNATNGRNGLPVIAAKDNLTIVGNGDTINAGGHGRLFDVAAGASLTLQNLTLQGGLVMSQMSQGMAAAEGAGIYNQGALTLSGVTVQDNIVQGFRGSGWPGNGQNAAGGGIYSTGALTLEGGTMVQNNQVLGGPGTLYTPEAVLTPGGNAYGGGICVAGGTATLSNVTLSSNTAQGGPGGSDAGYGLSFISGGSGGNAFGGALAVLGGTVSLTSVTISSNSAQGGAGGDGSGGYDYYGGSGGNAFGGGMYVAALAPATASLTNVTATNNDAAGAPGTAGGYYTGSPFPSPGWGYGGGLYIASHAIVDLDAFTLAHVINNTALTDPSIDGTYIEM